MAKLKKAKQESVDFGDFILYSHDKLHRVINGVVGEGGKTSGGLGKDASAEDIIANYDKLGGLIRTKDGQKVETGTFWDFVNDKPKGEINLKLAKKPNTEGIKINKKKVGDKGISKKSKIKEKDDEEDNEE